MDSDFGLLIRIAVIYIALHALFLMIRGKYHRWRSPAPSITSAQANACQKQAFQEICRRAAGPGQQVRMGDYFTARE
ncbi:hypothetical protein [Streptomyces sp. PTD5-9]|uniref:hypothetical protein n=1 Tax=Streptomyces sp. PTD5-9 TaxID=3120150 RepID=UPI00300ABF8E